MIKKLLLILAVMIMSSCASNGNAPVSKLYHRFLNSEQSFQQKSIRVHKTTALGILGNRPLVVLNQNGSLQQMNSNFWLESPKTLYWNYLKQTFSSTSPEYHLYSEIRRLEKSKSKSYVEIHFILRDEKGGDVFKKTYSQQRLSEDASVDLFVKSVRQSLTQITSDLIADLSDVK